MKPEQNFAKFDTIAYQMSDNEFAELVRKEERTYPGLVNGASDFMYSSTGDLEKDYQAALEMNEELLRGLERDCFVEELKEKK